MGVGIASMHYTGMAAMQMPATISYDPLLFTLSILIAIVASIVALWLAFHFGIASDTGGRMQWAKGGSALVMGAAIVGMHYTGMAAANFVPTGEATTEMVSGIDTFALGFDIGIVTLMILGIALASSIVDRKFSAKSAKLTESERRFESLFRNNPDGVFSFDTEGRLLVVNISAEKITGYSTDELRRMTLAELVATEEDLKTFTEYFKRAVGGEPQNYEVAITNKSGNRRDLSVVTFPIIMAGKAGGVYALVRDVTERKQAEEARSQLAAIVESSDDAIFGRTLDGTITSWNRGAEKLFGYTAEEAVGQTVSIILPPDRRDEMTQILERV
jgi:PAS domain S-box-containing protein